MKHKKRGCFKSLPSSPYPPTHAHPGSTGPVSSMKWSVWSPTSQSLHHHHPCLSRWKLKWMWATLCKYCLQSFKKKKAALKSLSWGLPWWLNGKDISLPMKETRVQSLDWEDSTCHRATKPVCHSYWACALEPESLGSLGVLGSYGAHGPQPWSLSALESVLCNKKPTAPQLESNPCCLQIEKKPVQK